MYTQIRNQTLKTFLLLFLLALAAVYLAVPINLVNSDVGRHIKNGELILAGQKDVLYKNYYSFTFPDYPFINHHWLAGVIFYLVHFWFGFKGLSILYISLILAAILLFLIQPAGFLIFKLLFSLPLLVFYYWLTARKSAPRGLVYFLWGFIFICYSVFNKKHCLPGCFSGLFPSPRCCG